MIDHIKRITQKEKSQNCIKAAIAFVCTGGKRQLLFAILQLITFVLSQPNPNTTKKLGETW